jgi:excinuclease ABC subunit C
MVQVAARQPQLSFLDSPVRADASPLREVVRRSARNVPGVYRMLGARGDVLYVGKSRQVRTRLLSYFRLPWPEHRHARLLRETAHIEWEDSPSEFAALLRETRLIRAHLPAYNRRGARPLDKWWVIVVPQGPVPRLRVQRASSAADRRSGQGDTIIGPFANKAPLVSALRVLNDALGLRDCADRTPMVLRDAGDFFADDPRYARTPACHRFETRRCLGPCVAACSQGEYRTQLQRARAFLDGDSDTPRTELAREMAVASAGLAFERAGWLRDRLVALETLESQLMRVREALQRPSFAYRVPSLHGADRLYLIRDGRVVAEARVDDVDALDRLLTLEGAPASRATALTVDALEELTLLEHWFRTRAEEQLRTAPSARALLQGSPSRPNHTGP